MTPSHPRAGEERLPDVVALCPHPDHTAEFYVSHGGPCPADGCDEQLVEYRPARLGPEPEVEANKQEQPSNQFVVALEREELEAILRNLPHEPGFHFGFGGHFNAARKKLRAALSEPRGGA